MIFLDNRQTTVEFNENHECILKEIIDYTLNEEGVTLAYEVSVILIDNAQIRSLNKDFRNIDKETDVLSFPMLEYVPKRVYKDTYVDFSFADEYFDEGNLVLGDIALSLEKAISQSVEYGHSFLREVCYLIIHSLLHLLGYDHMEEDEKTTMRKREEEILDKFNLKRDI